MIDQFYLSDILIIINIFLDGYCVINLHEIVD